MQSMQSNYAPQLLADEGRWQFGNSFRQDLPVLALPFL